MHLLKRRLFLLIILLSIAQILSCNRSQPTGGDNAVPQSEPPFSNTEPESYQTILVQTSPEGTVRFLIARDGDKWRIDSEYGLSSQTGSLHLDKKDYVLDFATKSYGEYTEATVSTNGPEWSRTFRMDFSIHAMLPLMK
jgi:hypothetical protein